MGLGTKSLNARMHTSVDRALLVTEYNHTALSENPQSKSHSNSFCSLLMTPSTCLHRGINAGIGQYPIRFSYLLYEDAMTTPSQNSVLYSGENMMSSTYPLQIFVNRSTTGLGMKSRNARAHASSDLIGWTIEYKHTVDSANPQSTSHSNSFRSCLTIPSICLVSQSFTDI